MEAVKREEAEGEDRLWGVNISRSGQGRCNDVPALLFTVSVTWPSHVSPLSSLSVFICKMRIMNPDAY